MSTIKLTTHELKIWPDPFNAVVRGTKTFEWRKDDRPDHYKVGDVLILQEWNPKTEEYTGLETVQRVTYVARDGFGMPPGYVIMSIEPLVEAERWRHSK